MFDQDKIKLPTQLLVSLIGLAAVLLISESATQGIWRRTDAQGRLAWPASPEGRWLLRGTQLRPSVDDPTRWDSGFVTLAFEVLAASAQTLKAGKR